MTVGGLNRRSLKHCVSFSTDDLFLLLFCNVSCEVLAPVQFLEGTWKPVDSRAEGREHSRRGVMGGSRLPRLPVYFGKGSPGQPTALPAPQEAPSHRIPAPLAHGHRQLQTVARNAEHQGGV